MDLCHKSAVEFMNGFLKKLPNHQYNRALKVACGDGRLTMDMLGKIYTKVDMFDKDPQGVEDAKENTINLDSIMTAVTSTMQEYEFDKIACYNGIYIRWAITYLDREEQLTFLQKA